MNAVAYCSLRLAVVAFVLLLAPHTVLAHEADHHAGEAKIAPGGAASAKAAPSCPPGSGHSCGCGNLEALSRGSQALAAAPVADAPVWEIPCDLSTRVAKRVFDETPPPSPFAFSSLHPRAPPRIADL